MSYDGDPFNEGDEDEGPKGNPIRTDRSKAGTSRFSVKVNEVSDVLDGDYGTYVILNATLLGQVDAAGGTQDDPLPAPEPGDDVTYLVSYVDPAEGKPKHIQEEIQKAIRKAGGPSKSFVREGDILHVKLAELQEKNAAGKKYPKGKEFGRHVVKVERAEADPFASDDAPF